MADSHRWRRIEELFHAALALPVDAREAFLARECGDDMKLRAEVESLLAQSSGEHIPASAVHVVVQVSRLSDGTRKVVSLAEITGMEGEVVTMQDIFTFRKRGIRENGEVIGEFVPTGVRPKFSEKLLVTGIQLPVSMFEGPQFL